MGKYLITGSPGSGKSTIVRALRRRGYKAYDSESMTGVTKLEDKATGKPAPWPEPPVDWGKYAFNWQEKGLKRLLGSDEDIFVAAAVSNQSKFYDLFDAIFVLRATPELLQKRLRGRRKKFGKLPEELRGILQYHEERERGYLAAAQAVSLDAAQPMEATIREIIAYAAAHR